MDEERVGGSWKRLDDSWFIYKLEFVLMLGEFVMRLSLCQ